jgi:precorrin-6A/cobalt-precorrin-6A reductase
MPTILSQGAEETGIGVELAAWVLSVDMALKVLILGGTSEARHLALRLLTERRFEALLSFAGRTEKLADPGVPYRVGGFGGADGLAAYLEREGFQVLLDATHPFAAQMSRNAARAAELCNVPLARLEPPPWRASAADRWITVPNMARAAQTLSSEPLGNTRRRVFLSIGRLELDAFEAAPGHDYLVRAIDPFEPRLPHARVIAARGPFTLPDELSLLERERIEVLVSKNAGTPSTRAKLDAARQLGLPVVMVARPDLPPVPLLPDAEAAHAWLARLHGASMRRGV